VEGRLLGDRLDEGLAHGAQSSVVVLQLARRRGSPKTTPSFGGVA
jgi:hypothetical protein